MFESNSSLLLMGSFCFRTKHIFPTTVNFLGEKLNVMGYTDGLYVSINNYYTTLRPIQIQ